MASHRGLGLSSGIVFANPPPADVALEAAALEALVAGAIEAADAAGITGAAVTPFLLDHVARNSEGQTVDVNVALLLSNARVGAAIATALTAT